MSTVVAVAWPPRTHSEFTLSAHTVEKSVIFVFFSAEVDGTAFAVERLSIELPETGCFDQSGHAVVSEALGQQPGRLSDGGDASLPNVPTSDSLSGLWRALWPVIRPIGLGRTPKCLGRLPGPKLPHACQISELHKANLHSGYWRHARPQVQG